MHPDRYSRTALAAAFYRAHHHLHDEPKLLDDPYAHRLLTAAEMAAFVDRLVRDGRELGLPGDDRTVLALTLRTVTPAATVLSRARYAEDRLALAIDRGVCQYVQIGAGLDTFAFRRPDLSDRVQVFELDHPESQRLKRERLAAAGLVPPRNLYFGPVDFEHQRLTDAFDTLPFCRDRPTVFAWLGVTMYLTRAAIETTWRALQTVAAAGSELVVDFIDPRALSATPTPSARKLRERTRAAGEPIISGLSPDLLGAELHRAGWTLVEQLDPGEIERRYLASGTDGYRARPMGHLACAGV